MNIILEGNITPELKERCTLLRLDQFFLKELDRTCTAYCALQNIPINEMSTLKNYIETHESMIDNFYKRNWNFCEQALEHLIGHWNGQLDTFYEHFSDRIKSYKESEPDDGWDGVIR